MILVCIQMRANIADKELFIIVIWRVEVNSQILPFLFAMPFKYSLFSIWTDKFSLIAIMFKRNLAFLRRFKSHFLIIRQNFLIVAYFLTVFIHFR